eukprot:261308_1
MAEANVKPKELYLDENVKISKGLPSDMIRLCNSCTDLNKRMEENLKMSHKAYEAFEKQSKNTNNNINNGNNIEWNFKDDLCLKHLETMRTHEQQMVMFQDEKIALLESTVETFESYIEKITKDLEQFDKILQPNQIKLPFPKKK